VGFFDIDNGVCLGIVVRRASRSRSQSATVTRPLEDRIMELYRSPTVLASSVLYLYSQLSRLHPSHASHERATREIRFEHIVQHPIALELFKDWLFGPFARIPPENGLNPFTAVMDAKKYRVCLTFQLIVNIDYIFLTKLIILSILYE
jgi:hypothetical protein